MGWVVLGVEGDVSAADITGSAPLSFGGRRHVFVQDRIGSPR